MIKITDIVKDYTAGDSVVHALKGISLSFRENEFVSILGPSGCGKTTLLNVLGGLDRYTSGEIEINGKSTKLFRDKDWDAYRNHYIGFIFQSYNLIPHLSVLENVEIALTIAGLDRKIKREKAKEALNRVGLGEQLNKKPNQLSGGQMQRVAIARAIVNNPKIILADEPTGALDSKTSKQIMELLKEIAGDHLIIMVTHNAELAKKYSTRIIKLLDGEVKSDSNPFTIEEKQDKSQNQEVADEEQKIEENNVKIDEKTQKKPKKDKKNKSSMSFWTAFMLSLKNLISKKGRTFMTSFAGSIGIIGIALVLAVSNGFSTYINDLQSTTLAGYPISVSTVTVNLDSLRQGMTDSDSDEELPEFPDSDEILSYDSEFNMITDLAKFSQYNFISPEFVEYMQAYKDEDDEKLDAQKTLNAMDFSYAYEMPVYTTNSSGEIIKVNTSLETSTMSGTQSGIFSEGLSNSDFVQSNYDVIAGTYPKEVTDLVLVVDSYNRLPASLLESLGIDSKESYTFDDILNKEYKVFTNNIYYKQDYTALDIENDLETITSYYNSQENSNVITCKISAILRIKEDNPTSIYSEGIKYSPLLTEHLRQINKQSDIVKAQLEEETETLLVPFVFNISELNMSIPFSSISSLISFAKTSYDIVLTTSQAKQYGLQMLGASDIPVAITLYPTSFDAKEEIANYIQNWNNTHPDNQIVYSDKTAFLTETMGQMVDIISYVLIAFASISLVVSSIMISIITYVSVIERTKEIGVLRSIGARKKDISRVFNAETLIIGLCSGILGVAVSFILTFPISAIVKNVAGGTFTANIAVLSPISALILVAISVVLTVIAGFIPAKMAAKKDPVKALRTE